MTNVADITLFENVARQAASRVVRNAGSGSPQMVPTRMDVEFGWKYRWTTDSQGRLGIHHASDVVSLGVAVRKNMKTVFQNLKNAVLNYNRAANQFSRDMKILQPMFTVQDNHQVAGFLSEIRDFQQASRDMFKQFNINMPTAR